ncbi:cytochrome P450 [Roseibium algae]|uniref:Cytochrome P450 n=1 Tax=Roseibium algae TaxID=3123038 RepID=A0ABU8TN93_9HYPH
MANIAHAEGLAPLAPLDNDITITQLTDDPYPIYQRLRTETPVLRVASVGRTLLTKATDTKWVKDNPELFSSDDPNTPMERALGAKTLMRRDGPDHMRLRNAMTSAFSAKNIRDVWIPAYERVVDDYISRLQPGETVDLFQTLTGPISARCLAILLGLNEASDEDMQLWSDTIIKGAGNFGWKPEIFAVCDRENARMDACISAAADNLRGKDDPSALSAMINAEDPIEFEQVIANIKIAIGGGINEPRDAALTAVYGLLTNPDQLEAVKADPKLWTIAFEEAVRWVAPIQVSSRRVTADTEIRGFRIPEGDVVMTIQASSNHDEEVYENGHLFDVFRPKLPHQAFGNGPHFCLGTHVARRMVGQILLPKLFERFPNLQLTDPKDAIFSGFGFRGPIILPVILS